MPILEEYWAGALTRVNAEVQTFTRLIKHNLQRGEENEAIFARLLERLLPRKYALGTGMVIDSFDNYSRQADVVIYNPSENPSLFAQSTELLFPVETVAAIGEVKTKLSSRDIDDIAEKVKDARKLIPRDVNPGSSDTYNGSLPYIVVLAYGTRVDPVTVYERFHAKSAIEQPDLLCIIDAAFVMCRNGEFEGTEPRNLSAGYCAAHIRDGVGHRQPGQYLAATDDVDETVDIGNHNYAAEPSRALLLFLQALSNALQLRRTADPNLMSLYLRPPVSELLHVRI